MKRESIHSVVRLLILLRVRRDALGRVRAGRTRHAAGQAGRATEERPTGLPSKMKWTFNFDAGWGTFGFANSLYDNPKEPGVEENLSDQWFEGYMKPALSASYTLASSSEVYGKISAVGERTYGSVPADFGQDVSSFGPEDLSNRVAVGKRIRGARRERAGRRRGPDAVPAGSWLPALRRSGRRRQPRRLLDERAQGVRARRDRPLQAGRTYGRSVLSRQGRARGERHRQPVVGRELRVRDRRAHDARRHLYEVVRRRRFGAGTRRV